MLKFFFEKQQRLCSEEERGNVLIVGNECRSNESVFFETLSEAIDSSYFGQKIKVLAGTHQAGNALQYLGLDESSLPLEWPNTIHVPMNWSIFITGEANATINGRFFLFNKSLSRFNSVDIFNHCSDRDSMVYGKSVISKQQDFVKRITGIALLEVWGTVQMEFCSLAINGGVCLLCVGTCCANISDCKIGGFHSNLSWTGPVPDFSAENVERRISELLGNNNRNAAQGISVMNDSKVAMRSCEICNVWNGGISVSQHSSAHIVGCSLHDVGYGLRLDGPVHVSVRQCRVAAREDDLLASGAFFADSDCSSATLSLEDNLIDGSHWIGPRRPGTLHVVGEASTPRSETSVDDKSEITISAPVRRSRRVGRAASWDEDSLENDQAIEAGRASCSRDQVFDASGASRLRPRDTQHRSGTGSRLPDEFSDEFTEDHAQRAEKLLAELRKFKDYIVQGTPSCPRFDLD
jgi:hypothetical protein